MALSISYANHIADALTRVGYKPRRWRHGILGTRVYECADRAVVVIPTIEIAPPHVHHIAKSIDDYFEKLRDVLTGLGKRLKVSDLFLPGGGTIPLPDWFREWCEQNGIRVHVVAPDDQLPRAWRL